MKRLLSTILLSAIAASAPVYADSRLSNGLSIGSAVVLAGPVSVLAGAGSIVIASVEAVADGVVLVLKSSVTGSQAVVKLSAEGAKGLSLVAGSVVEVSVMSTGYLLVQSGKVIAFIPNEIGTSLLHHSAAANGGAGK